MVRFYERLSTREKALVWVSTLAIIVAVFSLSGTNENVVAGAQVAASIGTFVLAGLAYAQVREIRETRIAESSPQVIVDADYSKPPLVYVVVRNIGKGAARNVSFEFSADVEAPEGENNPLLVPLNKQGYFSEGMDFLAPGAEIRNLWGSMITLAGFLEQKNLSDGITIASTYESLEGKSYESKVTVNPLLIRNRISTKEKGVNELVEAVEQLSQEISEYK